jgi:hypothetical protein
VRVLKLRKEEPMVAVAMVALHRPALLPEDALVAWLQGHAEDMPPLTKLVRNDGTIVAEVGTATVAIALVRTAIPWSQLEGPCAVAWWWPEATQVMKRHGAHLIVTVTGGTVDVIQRNCG